MSQENNGDELNEKLAKLQNLDVEDEEDESLGLSDETVEPEPAAEPLPEASEEEAPSAEAEPDEKEEEKKEKKSKLSRFKRKKSHLKELKPPMAERVAKGLETARSKTRSGLETVQVVGNAMEKMGDGMLNSSEGTGASVPTGTPTQKPATSTRLREVDPKELEK